ncbi:hypothetical protein F5Y04DRAFT_292698 [Hypomontagnella monticulosa]|nr:hypothetical protein F5Y04DRAFT_292698 [Hypomontagnella monticulosa]
MKTCPSMSRDLMICRMRDKVRRLAIFQNDIWDTLETFNSGGDEVKQFYKDVRNQYLGALEMNLQELRELMLTTPSHISDEGVFYEAITKRVPPKLTDRVLSALVDSGDITQNDKECILAGNYETVQEFFDDMERQALDVGLDNDKFTTYDENGFLISGEEAARIQNEMDSDLPMLDAEPDTGIELSADDAEKELFASLGTTPLVALPTSLTLSDITPSPTSTTHQGASTSTVNTDNLTEASKSPDESIEELSTENLLKHESTTLADTPKSITEVSEYGGSMTVDEDDNDSLTLHRCSNSGTEITVEHDENAGGDEDDEDLENTPSKRMLKYALEYYVAIAATPDWETQKDSLEDLWLEEEDMFYWKYETMFVVKLTAFRFKSYFREAREVYKVDPFLDYN